MIFANYEKLMLALCVWREARSEPEIARRGVLWVILNRTNAPSRWKPSPIQVILQPKQFSSFNRYDVQSVKFPNPAVAKDWEAFGEICDLVENPGKDPTQGANHFFDSSIPAPSWADPKKLTLCAGRLNFYRL